MKIEKVLLLALFILSFFVLTAIATVYPPGVLTPQPTPMLSPIWKTGSNYGGNYRSMNCTNGICNDEGAGWQTDPVGSYTERRVFTCPAGSTHIRYYYKAITEGNYDFFGSFQSNGTVLQAKTSGTIMGSFGWSDYYESPDVMFQFNADSSSNAYGIHITGIGCNESGGVETIYNIWNESTVVDNNTLWGAWLTEAYQSVDIFTMNGSTLIDIAVEGADLVTGCENFSGFPIYTCPEGTNAIRVYFKKAVTLTFCDLFVDNMSGGSCSNELWSYTGTPSNTNWSTYFPAENFSIRTEQGQGTPMIVSHVDCNGSGVTTTSSTTTTLYPTDGSNWEINLSTNPEFTGVEITAGNITFTGDGTWTMTTTNITLESIEPVPGLIKLFKELIWIAEA